ncbi:discoidin domain-containing protein [Paucibacter sp. PLA-PC-4]|uniref:di-heme oxidoredictase family protein n=1 Tax=Paucibacter sp. PLA-PC-4 TaxID=2993655 RepID=UPI00224B9F0D|nr:di-heme oxidoredictase family protein [Paucibacter sp. PLA-PC-4]MCX2865761.1 discoidin domain-containing protein [Paucibacter sp. PLA-PC-4]
MRSAATATIPAARHSRRQCALLWASPLLAGMLAACGGGAGSDASSQSSAAVAADAPRARVMAAGTEAEVVLRPVSAVASSMERGDLGADKAIDGDVGTRWSSAFADPQYLTLDYGQVVSITRVQIQWENAHARKYEVQVSEDGGSWTTLRSVGDSAGGVENFEGLNGRGRYLRMQGVQRAGQYGYSIFEIQAYSGGASPELPPAEPEPVPAPDPGQPSMLLKPVEATASASENGDLAPAKAIDGNRSSRWASNSEDQAWIQFDLGSKKAIGSLKLVWENAYGKEYQLLVSDNGQDWALLRHVAAGKGGTEEFLNLGVSARHLKLQGVKRATQYGYSLFEVEIRSHGSDNSLPLLATSPYPLPRAGATPQPLFQAQAPLETLQFTLPDGTLVTRFGARAMGRHGRERGEEWNEAGYGPNETVDPVTGAPVDKGPGAYLPFVPQYFKNRTWGMEIIDNSRVAGVAKPSLVVNQYSQVDFLPGGVAFFRAFDRVGVTGYGWMAPGELQDRNVALCKPQAIPAAGALSAPGGINGACTLVVKNYPGYNGIGADGLPNGKYVPGRALVRGDVIEVAPSMFTTRESLDAQRDNGGVRYYSGEWVYVVGQGLAPWYGVQPRLNSVPLPTETLSGGVGSVSYNYSDNGSNMFQQPPNHVGMQNMQRFVEGRRLIHSSFVTGEHSEPGNDRHIAVAGLVGAQFNQSACVQCHTNNGRSPAPAQLNQRLDTMSIRTGVLDADGRQRPHPRYGAAVQMNAVAANGAPQDWGHGVRIAGFESRSVKLADGTTIELRKPRLAFDGPVPELYSLRSAQPMIGVGLLEAVSEADILARVRTTPDEDGVMGRANFVLDPETGETRLGRFGWKASKASLRHQVAAALLQDMSVTSPIYPSRQCHADPAGCHTAPSQTGIAESDLTALTRYMALVAVPAQRSLASGFPKGVAPIDEHRVDPAHVQLGQRLFEAMRCAACHTPTHKTGKTHPFAELREQTIRPYTDLLLHDMGPELADKLAEGTAGGALWRTPALWGIGYTAKVQGGESKVGYLHDGRARTLTEAILWHGGEGDRARQRFEKLSAADREAVLAFLRSL